MGHNREDVWLTRPPFPSSFIVCLRMGSKHLIQHKNTQILPLRETKILNDVSEHDGKNKSTIFLANYQSQNMLQGNASLKYFSYY